MRGGNACLGLLWCLVLLLWSAEELLSYGGLYKSHASESWKCFFLMLCMGVSVVQLYISRNYSSVDIGLYKPPYHSNFPANNSTKYSINPI